MLTIPKGNSIMMKKQKITAILAFAIAFGLGMADEIDRGHMVLLHAYFFSFSL